MTPDISALPTFPRFQQTFQGDLILPSDPRYPKAIQRWSSWAQREAGLVAYVKVESDVSSVIRFAIAEKLELAIKGGGHNPSGASSTTGGIVIDLSRYMNRVVVDPRAKIAHVGGGATWTDVDRECIKYNLASVGGTVGDTGVGGLTVGGGYGYLSGEHGLVIDNVDGLTLVTSDGSILEVTADAHPDLFWAVRGGGSNFGVVTTFHLRVHPQTRDIWAGNMIFSADKLEAVFKTAETWKRDDMGPKDTMMIACVHSPDTGAPAIICICCHNGPVPDAEKSFAPFKALGPLIDETGLMPYEKLNAQFIAANPPDRYVYMCSATQMRPSYKVARQVFDAYTARIAAQPQYGASLLLFVLFFGSGYRTEYSDRAAFNCRGPHSIVLVQIVDSSENADVEEAWAFGRQLSGLIDSGEGDAETPYGNYEGDPTEGQEKTIKLFKNHYSRLKVIKAKYDPDQVFKKWFPIEPAATAAAA